MCRTTSAVTRCSSCGGGSTPTRSGHTVPWDTGPRPSMANNPTGTKLGAASLREHVCGGSGVEEASKPEPPYDAASHPFGEGRQVGRRDRPRGQEHGQSVGPLQKHPVGDARVQSSGGH